LTPEQRIQLEQLLQIKATLSECYCNEADFLMFLMDCLDKYGLGLPTDETFKAKWFSDRIHAQMQKIKVQLDQPPDKLPVYLVGGWLWSTGSTTETKTSWNHSRPYSLVHVVTSAGPTEPQVQFELLPCVRTRHE
jgi:hypothetical protein